MSSLLSSPRIRTVSSSSSSVDPLESTTTSTTTSPSSPIPLPGFTTPQKQKQQQSNNSDRVDDDSKKNVGRSCGNKWQRIFHRNVNQLERKSPLVKKTMDTARKIPKRWRYVFLCGWLLWKMMSFYILFQITYHTGGGTLHLLGLYDSYHDSSSSSIQQQQQQDHQTTTLLSEKEHSTKLLYIVTALAEYNNGLRSTIKGQDRLAEVLIPVLVETVEGLLSVHTFDVDVYLILGYELKPERRKLIQSRLPPTVGLEVWDDAIPLGYSKEHGYEVIQHNTRALARQHRFVIKDKMKYYDLFLVLEDDMKMSGIQVQHFMEMSNELEQLESKAPHTTEGVPEIDLEPNGNPNTMKYYGNMTKGQLKRMIPGWIRVEVLNNEEQYGAQQNLDPIELDYTFPTTDLILQQEQEYHIDPTICCHIPNMKPTTADTANVKPNTSDVIVWETNVRALQLREMPRYNHESNPISNKLDWTVLLLGPGKREKQEEKVGGYWSGRIPINGEPPFGSDFKRPSGGPPDLVAQQGGWLLTRSQILHLDIELCQASFLPPFSLPIYHEDGHQAMNVEYWSGSYQIFNGVRGGCNMQRILSFHPQHFSKHLVYHVANNKQKQIKQERMVRADHIWGQLVTVYKRAMQDKKKKKEQETKR